MAKMMFGVLALACALFGCTYNTNETAPSSAAGVDLNSLVQCTVETVTEAADGGTTTGDDGGMREAPNDPNQRVQGGWSQSGPLVQFSGSQRVKCQANLPESTVYTVQFNIVPPSPRTFGGENYVFAYRAISVIKWSVEGSYVQRMIDIGNGTAISGPAQGFNLWVQDESDTSIVTPLPSPATITNGSPTVSWANAGDLTPGDLVVFSDQPTQTYQVDTILSAGQFQLTTNYTGPNDANATMFLAQQYVATIQVSEGLRANPEIPATLFGTSVSLAENPNSGDEVSIDIPQNAGVNSVEVVGSNADGSKLNVVVTQQVGPTSPFVSKSYDPTINTGFVAIMPNATSIKVVNLSATSAASIAITFGVDG